VDLLKQEFPRAYFLICSSLVGRTISLTVDGETMFLECKAFELVFRDRIEDLEVRIVTDGSTILDAVDGVITIQEAIRTGRLFAGGRSDHLTACHAALLFFVRGAVRSPSFPMLLDEFRRFVLSPPAR
jgi:hypothetical protein